MKLKKYQLGVAAPLVIVIVGVVVMVVGGTFAYFQLRSTKPATQSTQQPQSATRETSGFEIQSPIATSPSKKPGEKPGERPTELANWKTYKNSKAGFQISYPPEMVSKEEKTEPPILPIGESNQIISFTIPNDPSLGFGIESAVNILQEAPNPQTLAEIWQMTSAGETELSKINLGGKDGYKVEIKTKPGEPAIFIIYSYGKNQNSLLLIIITTTGDEAKKIADQMLASLKFL